MSVRDLPSGSIGAVEILRRLGALLARFQLRIGFWTALLIGAGVIVDATRIGWEHEAAATFSLSVFNLIAQYALTKWVLRDLTGRVAGAPRFLAFVGLGIVVSLGILVGMVLLIVPGIVLLVRWSIAVPILLSSNDQGIGDAIRRSWHETGPHFWAILLAYLAIYGPAFGFMFIGLMIEGEMRENVAGTLIFEVALSVGLVFGWLAAIAIHHALDDAAELEQVFE